jgi:hypothetical protein
VKSHRIIAKLNTAGLAHVCAAAVCFLPAPPDVCRAQAFGEFHHGPATIGPRPASLPAESFKAVLPSVSQEIVPAPGYAPAGPVPQSPEQTNAPVVVGERSAIVVFTSQSTPKIPRYAHTWATLVRIVFVLDPSTGQAAPQIVGVATISWMPRSHVIKPFVYLVEPGVNLPLDPTIDLVLADGKERITAWGPLEATPALCTRFLEQKAFLESGAIGYQCVDALGEAALRHNGVNCIHAVTPALGYSGVDLLQLYGDDSGAGIAATLVRRKLAMPYTPADEWVLDALNYRGLPMARRLPYGGVAGQR